MENIQKNLTKIKANIADAAKKYQRDPESVTLVAVSKSQSIDKIKIASKFGQIDFGENYLQESILKIKELADVKIIWHYIGRIQSNKTKLIAQNFSWVESITSYKIAELLSRHRPPNLPPLNICIQVNLNKEPSKAGVYGDEILPLAKKIMQLPRLKLRGLMAIPAHQERFEQQFQSFNALALEFKKLQHHGILVDTLSMGMSDDFVAAIAAGATMVRIGRAIFGERNAED